MDLLLPINYRRHVHHAHATARFITSCHATLVEIHGIHMAMIMAVDFTQCDGNGQAMSSASRRCERISMRIASTSPLCEKLFLLHCMRIIPILSLLPPCLRRLRAFPTAAGRTFGRVGRTLLKLPRRSPLSFLLPCLAQLRLPVFVFRLRLLPLES